MKGLLIKDFRLLKNQKSFLLTFLLIGVGMLFTELDSFLIISYLTFLFSAFAVSSISYDELDNGFAFLFTLPVSRRGYVAEKYLFGLLFGGGAWFISTLLTTVIAAFRQGEGLLEIFPAVFVYLVMILIYLSIVLPIQLKFGAEKGRLIILGTVILIYLAGFLLTRGLRYLNDHENIYLAGALKENYVAAAVVFAAVSIMLFVLSYALSVRIMEKKQV